MSLFDRDSVPTSRDAGTALFIRFSSLGDVVLTIPVLRSFRAACPDRRILFLTKSVYAPIFEGSPYVDQVDQLEELPSGGHLPRLVGYGRRLKDIDTVVDLHGSLRSTVVSFFVSAGTKLRYRKDTIRRKMWTAGWMRGTMAGEKRHVVEKYHETIAPLGAPQPSRDPWLYPTEEELKDAVDFLKIEGVRHPEKMVVIFPGASRPNKSWDATGFAAVGQWVSKDLQAEVVLAGDEQDREQIEKVKRNMSSPVCDIAGRTSLRRLLAILKLGRAALGNDSGPGHLAAAVGTPVLSIFGPTSEAFGFTPWGEKTAVLSRPLECRPCSLHGGEGCRRGRRACLDDIAPGEVMDALKELVLQRAAVR